MFLCDLISTVGERVNFYASVLACYYGWKDILSVQLAPSTLGVDQADRPSAPGCDEIADAIKCVLVRNADDAKTTTMMPLNSRFNRMLKELDWDTRETHTVPDIQTPFSCEISSYIENAADASIVTRGGYPNKLQFELKLAWRCQEILCAKMPDAWATNKFTTWILPALSETTSTADFQGRALLAAAPWIVRYLKASRKLVETDRILDLICLCLTSSLRT